MSRPRDSYRARVYRAEREAFPGFETPDPELATVEAIEMFTDRVLGRDRVEARFPEATSAGAVNVRPGHGARFARGGTAPGDRRRMEITIPRWARSKLVVLHELAHAMAEVEFGYGRCAWHGHEWAATYLFLVGEVLGVTERKRLLAAFKKHRVPVRPKKKSNRPPMTDAEKAEFVERMRASRERKRIDA